MRVLHYIPGFLYGGIESLFLSWYKNIDHKNVQFELLLRTQDDQAKALDEYRKLGGVYYRLPPFTPRHYFEFKKELNRFFQAHHDYDILHVHGETPFVISTSKKYGIPVVIVHSHASSPDPGFKEHTKNFFYSLETIPARNRFVDCAFACSALAAKNGFDGMTFKGKPVEIIHNAIETELFDYNETVRNRVRHVLGVENCFVIGHTGRMSYAKNQFFLLEIFKQYLGINPNSVLWMIGDGPDEERLKKQATELGITGNIMFFGVRNDVAELLQGMDCFLLPSRSEGFGIAIIEAQTSGLPCLISDVIPEQVDLTDVVIRLPLTVPAEKWAEKIEQIRQTVTRRSQKAKIIEEGFDARKQTEKLISLYSALLEEKMSRRRNSF